MEKQLFYKNSKFKIFVVSQIMSNKNLITSTFVLHDRKFTQRAYLNRVQRVPNHNRASPSKASRNEVLYS